MQHPTAQTYKHLANSHPVTKEIEVFGYQLQVQNETGKPKNRIISLGYACYESVHYHQLKIAH